MKISELLDRVVEELNVACGERDCDESWNEDEYWECEECDRCENLMLREEIRKLQATMKPGKCEL